jgi:YD repeat-containing protein
MRFIVALLLMTDVAMAQVENRIYHDAIGRNTGRSVTDSRGNVTYYDAMGRTTGRSTTNGNTTTVYDQMGRQIGTIRSR